MSVSGLGKLAGKAAGRAAETVGGLVGTAAYPETEYALAAYLFERIAQAERDTEDRSRDYYLDLMRACLEVVRAPK